MGTTYDFFAKQRASERLDNKCEGCGEVAYLFAHHRVPRSQGGRTTNENLVMLCQDCHDKAHNKKSAKRYDPNLGPVGDSSSWVKK